MSRDNLFYRYYDALFHDKDYTSETNLIFELSRKFGIASPRKLLEVGCGTGNHTQELAKRGIPLVSIDIDKNMAALAKEKIKQSHVRIEHTRIEDLQDKNFDVIMALFNIVTYIPTVPELISFMDGVAARLRRRGIFVFDCWNGVAAMKDPPRVKKVSVRHDNKTIDCTITPKTDFFNQITTLTYDFKVTDGSKIEKDSFSIPQILWTPMQIRWAVEQSGLEVVLCSPFLGIKRPATQDDWKIMFCCRKPIVR